MVATEYTSARSPPPPPPPPWVLQVNARAAHSWLCRMWGPIDLYGQGLSQPWPQYCRAILPRWIRLPTVRIHSRRALQAVHWGSKFAHWSGVTRRLGVGIRSPSLC